MQGTTPESSRTGQGREGVRCCWDGADPDGHLPFLEGKSSECQLVAPPPHSWHALPSVRPLRGRLQQLIIYIPGITSCLRCLPPPEDAGDTGGWLKDKLWQLVAGCVITPLLPLTTVPAVGVVCYPLSAVMTASLPLITSTCLTAAASLLLPLSRAPSSSPSSPPEPGSVPQHHQPHGLTLNRRQTLATQVSATLNLRARTGRRVVLTPNSQYGIPPAARGGPSTRPMVGAAGGARGVGVGGSWFMGKAGGHGEVGGSHGGQTDGSWGGGGREGGGPLGTRENEMKEGA